MVVSRRLSEPFYITKPHQACRLVGFSFYGLALSLAESDTLNRRLGAKVRAKCSRGPVARV